MRVYFYHTQDIQRILRLWRQGACMGHLLYGATHLSELGINVEWHRYIPHASRLKRMVITTWRVLRLGRRVDAIFATHYQGIEPLILLRAMGLLGKPIVLWMHQPVLRPHNPLKRKLAWLFYRGADEMVFFSQKIIDDSVATGLIPRGKTHLGHWGADLDFYDRLLRDRPARAGFVSSGKERRDMPTLVRAFARAGATVDVYLPSRGGGEDYAAQLAHVDIPPNVRLHLDTSLGYPDFAREVSRHACACVCCRETNYTVGLTTVVEAMALGLPLICSDNPQLPFDIQAEGCGLTVPYGDVDGWVRAIMWMTTHPREARDMGRRGRQLAERDYNDRRTAAIIAKLIRSSLNFVSFEV